MTKEEINKKKEVFKYIFYGFTGLDPSEVKIEITIEYFKDKIESMYWFFYCKTVTFPEPTPITKKIKEFNDGICKFFSHHDFDTSLRILKSADKKYKEALIGDMVYKLDNEELSIMFEFVYNFD